MGIPVIDMQNIDGGDREAIMAEIAKACESTGFFQLLNHGIEQELMDRVKKVCSEHYKLNREQSFNDSLPVRLLTNALAAQDSDEANKIENVDWEDVFQVHEMQETDSWPSQPSDFKETIQEFRDQIFSLTEKLLKLISLNLGLEKEYLREAFAGGEKPFFGTKVSHYPPCPRPDLINGIRAHTDAGGLILLYQDDQVSGLQVLHNGTWVDVQPIPYAIVVDIGDQLEAITNGKYTSAWHRILPTKNGNRFSVASFYNPSYNAKIYPAPQLVAEANGGETSDEVVIYPEYLCGDYMRVYSQQKYEAKEPRFEAMRTVNVECQ